MTKSKEKKRIYQYTVIEHLSKTGTVEATSTEEAYRLIEIAYKKEEIILDGNCDVESEILIADLTQQ